MAKQNFKAEYVKQDEAIKKLKTGYQYPLFNAKYAIESSRRTAYKDTASAAQEIVDNSIEAGASNIHVIFDREEAKRKGKKTQKVSQIAFIDDGAGMSPEMLRFALSWGGGIHHENPDFIGKFGFGLPNSSVNQTRLTKVYSKRMIDKEWMVCSLDIDNLNNDGAVTIPPATKGEIPEFVQSYLERNKISLESGTVVIWIKPDRLFRHTVAKLAEHIVDRFGVTYRYLLKNTTVIVNGKKVQPIDPLFITPGCRFYLPVNEKGAKPAVDMELVVKYYQDPDTGEPKLEKIETNGKLPDESEKDVLVGAIRVKTAYFPPGFAFGRKRPGVESLDEHSKKRMIIRQNGRRGVAFVRAGREIEVSDAFPRNKGDKASGLGKWPLMQSYAYHYGIEVMMDPELDEAFGITNDKQGVRPVPNFWKLLANEELDKHLYNLDRKVQKGFKDAEKADTTAKTGRPSETQTPAERAVAMADRARGRMPTVPDHELDEVKQKEEKAAKKRLEEKGEPINEETIGKVKSDMLKASRMRQYLVDYEFVPDGPFFRPEWRDSHQKVAWVNMAHPFYTTLYLSVIKEGGDTAKQAVDALLLCLAKAELTSENKDLRFIYKVQRKEVWSKDLELVMKHLENQEGLENFEQESEEIPEAADN